MCVTGVIVETNREIGARRRRRRRKGGNRKGTCVCVCVMTLSSLKECENELRVVRGIHWSGKAAAAAAVVVCVTHPPHPLTHTIWYNSLCCNCRRRRRRVMKGAVTTTDAAASCQVSLIHKSMLQVLRGWTNERTNEEEKEDEEWREVKTRLWSVKDYLQQQQRWRRRRRREGGRRGRIVVKEFMNVSTVSKSWSRDREKKTWTSGKSKMHSRAHF